MRCIITLLLIFISTFFTFSQKISVTKSITDSNFTILGRLVDGPCNTSYVIGNLALIGKGVELEIVDISNPSSPNLLSSLIVGGNIQKIDVKDNFAIIAASEMGIRIVDINNPHQPFEISSFVLNGQSIEALDIFVRDDLVYIAYGYAGLTIVDISDPYSPSEIGFYDYGSEYNAISVKDSLAFISDLFNGMFIVNISNPNGPFLVGSYFENWGFFSYFDIYVDNNYAYLLRDEEYGTENTVRIIDISDVSNPVLSGFYITPGVAYSITVQEDVAFIADGENGLQILNISNPQNVYLVGYLNTNGNSVDLFLQSSTVYLSDQTNGFRIIDVNNVTSPIELGFYPAGGEASCTFTKNNYLYLASGKGLEIFDISNLQSIEKIGYYDCGPELIIFVDGEYAYISNFTTLRIISVADPLNLYQVGTYITPQYSPILDIYVEGDIAYLSINSSSDGLLILDVSDKSNPILLGSNSVTGPGEEICIQGQYAYMACSQNGFRIFDISSPQYPFEVNNFWRDDLNCYGASVQGNYSYISYGGFMVLDISDPTNPFDIASIYGGDPLKVEVKDNFAYVNYYDNTIKSINITSPNNPFISGSFSADDQINSIKFQNNLLFVSAGNAGVYILKNDLTTQTDDLIKLNTECSLSQNHPNPFNPTTKISYQLTELCKVRLSIYDVLGREVSTIVNEEKTAGIYDITWNAENLPSGVYFYQIKAGNFIQTKKMILLK